jgi:hypothetical protein
MNTSHKLPSVALIEPFLPSKPTNPTPTPANIPEPILLPAVAELKALMH